MAIRKLSSKFVACCIVCFALVNLVQVCQTQEVSCSTVDIDFDIDANTTWAEDRCPEGQRQVCVDLGETTTSPASNDSTTANTTEVVTSPATGANTSAAVLEDDQSQKRVLCAFCPQGQYLVHNGGSGNGTNATFGCENCPDGCRICTGPDSCLDQKAGPPWVIIGGAIVGGVALIIIVIVIIVCVRKRCCCNGRPSSSSLDLTNLEKGGCGELQNKLGEDGSDGGKKKKGRYTPMPAPLSAEDPEVLALPIAPKPPKTSRSKRFSVKIGFLSRKSKKKPEEAPGYITMHNIKTAASASSPVASDPAPEDESEPIYQNQEELGVSAGEADQEIYENQEGLEDVQEIYENQGLEDDQEIYENQGLEDDQEIYENQVVLETSLNRASGSPGIPVSDTIPEDAGEEMYYNVGDEEYKNPRERSSRKT